MKAKTLALGVLFAFVAAPAVAQEVKIEARPPARERPEIVKPGLNYERTKPREHDFYRDGPRVEHDPGFIEGLSGEYETANSRGRAGIAGWTSPNLPVGASVANGYDNVTGWFGLGFSVTWGGPPRPARPSAK
jgi:hypothetical protein